MKTIEVKDEQILLDIALQYYGTAEATGEIVAIDLVVYTSTALYEPSSTPRAIALSPDGSVLVVGTDDVRDANGNDATPDQTYFLASRTQPLCVNGASTAPVYKASTWRSANEAKPEPDHTASCRQAGSFSRSCSSAAGSRPWTGSVPIPAPSRRAICFWLLKEKILTGMPF